MPLLLRSRYFFEIVLERVLDPISAGYRFNPVLGLLPALTSTSNALSLLSSAKLVLDTLLKLLDIFLRGRKKLFFY